MASAPKPEETATKSNLTPSITLKGHGKWIRSISYFPDGQRMISGSEDKTARQWDLKAGKEIEEARDVRVEEVWAVAVSKDGRWVVTASGGDGYGAELKASQVETRSVRTFEGHSRRITCIDISVDNTLLASGSDDFTTRIWSLETGRLVAVPFKSFHYVSTVRFSTDSKKLAIMSLVGKHLEIWDVQSQKLDVRKVKYPASGDGATYPLFWTNDNKNILGAFRFTNDNPSTIFCEFDASTLETVGVPFEGHSDLVTGLALSFDGSLLASAAWDNTIKLWAFESRQLLASFHVQNPYILTLSPDSHQLAYTTITNDEICICDIPLEVLAQTSVHLKGPTADFQRISSSRPPQLPPDPREPLAPSSHTHTVSPARSVESDALPPEATLKDLTKHIIKDGNYPVARGGFGEIWKSTLHIDNSSLKVAVKALQVYAEDELTVAKRKKIKRIKRELRICANLKHANILPVFGYTHGFGPFPAIVSPWAENGNLTVYLEREGEALTLVQRFQLLRDIIAGLQYLHANNVIHGDFNGPNVLIHGDGTACVADFGLSLMYSEVISASQASWTSTLKGNMRWMAPELLVEREDGSQARPTKQSDMYSFGGIMLQVLTNKMPYYHLTNDATIILCIAKSQTPSRSRYPELPEQYWEFIEQCWSTDPQDRPSTEVTDTTISNEFDLLSISR